VYLLGKDAAELEELASSLGERAFRGRQLYRWLYVKEADGFAEMNDLAKGFRKRLSEKVMISPVRVDDVSRSAGGSVKLLFALPDGNRVEGVLIPDGERLTACLSSQVGCVIGCRFCATGRMGFIRNLSAAEIVGQFIAMNKAVRMKISNVVMMGMGEPLLNRRELFKAAGLITDPDGLGISRRRFSVSTVGWVPGIEAMRASGLRLKLTVSLNGTTDGQRRKLMPLAARFPLADVLHAAKEYASHTRQRLTFTYLLLAGINDSPVDARRLIKLVSRIPSKINLMEYNEIGGEFRRSDDIVTEDFQEILRSAGLTATLRKSRGLEIGAACGQLAGRYAPGSGRVLKAIY